MTDSSTCPQTQPALNSLHRLWLLRLLVPLGGQREFIEKSWFRCDRTAIALGLVPESGQQLGKFDEEEAKSRLAQLHHQAELTAAECQLPYMLQRNIQRLAELVAMNELEQRLLAFVVELHNERLLDDAADWLGMLSSAKVHHALSILLNAPLKDIRQALRSTSKLGTTGLVKLDNRGVGTLKSKLDLLSDTFADRISSTDSDPIQILRDVVLPGSPPVLGVQDYVHITDKLDVLIAYLRKAITARKPGVNVFVYGPPGTGKSQLARVVAQTLGVELFEVASEDSDGDPTSGERRLRAYRAAQGFLSNRASLILFDEVEDVFDDGNWLVGKRSTAQARKAWLNNALENNSVPTLWLSNSIKSVDPAFMRRYDLVIELPVPPRSVHLRHLQSTCHQVLDAETMVRVAEAEHAAPALISRASEVVSAIQHDMTASSPAKTFEWIVNDTLRAQGHTTIPRTSTTLTSGIYDPAFVQADTDLQSVVEGLKANFSSHASARLCLYGPPGTGKTAFGHWLARQLDRPLFIKRASDLLDKYLGQTEQRIARAFQEAEVEQAVFILDEVDSFLQDRRYAQHDWEMTRVNELLTQMEAFNGVFIASTNLMDSLDQAALSRFDLKVKFDFLAPHQATALLERYCHLWWLAEPDGHARDRVGRIRNVTPGDFATLARQHRFHPFQHTKALVEALVSACALKEGAGRAPIGFVTGHVK